MSVTTWSGPALATGFALETSVGLGSGVAGTSVAVGSGVVVALGYGVTVAVGLGVALGDGVGPITGGAMNGGGKPPIDAAVVPA
jgi:hypothetical protein